MINLVLNTDWQLISGVKLLQEMLKFEYRAKAFLCRTAYHSAIGLSQ